MSAEYGLALAASVTLVGVAQHVASNLTCSILLDRLNLKVSLW